MGCANSTPVERRVETNTPSKVRTPTSMGTHSDGLDHSRCNSLWKKRNPFPLKKQKTKHLKMKSRAKNKLVKRKTTDWRVRLTKKKSPRRPAYSMNLQKNRPSRKQTRRQILLPNKITKKKNPYNWIVRDILDTIVLHGKNDKRSRVNYSAKNRTNPKKMSRNFSKKRNIQYWPLA